MEKITPQEQLLLTQLKSDSIAVVQQAISDVTEKGKAIFVPAILEAYRDCKQEAVRSRFENLLIGLKIQACVPYIMNAIGDEEYAGQKRFLISLGWQSSLDFSKYISDFIDLLILEEDFMNAFEAFTVLENMEGSYHTDELLEYIQKLKNASLKADEQRSNLMIDLIHLLENSIEG